jgi:N-methylhydantoinase A/oxoprolinase/acetone carboxylase beta subunit
MALRVGVDCGGTNTDAAVLAADGRVLGWAKHQTTDDVLTGVVAAVRAALETAGQGECAALPATVCSAS